MDQLERIKRMEELLDDSMASIRGLAAAIEEYAAAREGYRELCAYYDSALWLRDYEDDEAGKLPPDLKRGVLSQDAVYDLLSEDRQLLDRIRKLLAEEMKEP